MLDNSIYYYKPNEREAFLTPQMLHPCFLNSVLHPSTQMAFSNHLLQLELYNNHPCAGPSRVGCEKITFERHQKIGLVFIQSNVSQIFVLFYNSISKVRLDQPSRRFQWHNSCHIYGDLRDHWEINFI